MKRPLRILWHDIPASEAVETAIRERAEKLERFSTRLVGVDVTVERPHKHHHQGNLYNVRIDLKAARVPKATVNAQPDEDVYVSLRDAFDAARRKLEDLERRRRGQTKTLRRPSRRPAAAPEGETAERPRRPAPTTAT